MRAEDFTKKAEVVEIVADLQSRLAGIRKKGKWISDIIDAEGNQYVDLVMEGGGALGIALLGYIYVLEQAGIRFLQLGGTSAGSITTLLLAVAGAINEQKSPWLIEEIANKKLGEFVDGDADARDFLYMLLNNPKTINLIWKGIQVRDNLKQDFGLNPGRAFHSWLSGLLEEKGIRSYQDLLKVREKTPIGLHNRISKALVGPEAFKRIAMVAADITTQTKAVFPEMAPLYYHQPDTTVNLADYVRASVSIPIFFHPFKIESIPDGESARQQWQQLTGYSGEIPEEVYFIDGGIMSNFPIDLFHNYYKIPEAPTFGVKLGADRTAPNVINRFPEFLRATINSAWQFHDDDFILKNPDYRQLVCWVDTGPYNWLNLNLSDAEQIDLFIRGAQSAATFINLFDWEEYKQLRASSMQVFAKGAAVNFLKKFT